jgi:hydroxymethylpyrimidine/phosphomethylpyrimidine kinase
VKVALTVAGSDSGGGAGLQADLKTFAAHGVHGTSAVTAVTAQNSVAVTSWVALEPAMVAEQIETVAVDMPVAAVKTGMLANAAIVEAVARAVERLALPNLVVDPVMVAKGGHRLLDPDAERAYVRTLFPRALLVTPNLLEAGALLGRVIATRDDMRAAAQELRAMGPRAALVKGGHLPGDALDVLCDEEGLLELPAPRIDTKNTHGTGCTYSAAIAARLAQGASLRQAVTGAKEYVTEAIRRSYSVGAGHGPLDHLHPLRSSR